ncbi:hypothetical protein GP486_005422 [Trichoglossum hirsutum]|uniref:Uncharacterized protein n=1 Tax=Trichoglossum hirsutum TaxID=265104 RepID=A0A9P8L974_9PEZI|nr:hypothetical protein GP486_005422 [Trichoglossum hirsutum]
MAQSAPHDHDDGERQALLPHPRELIISASFIYPLKAYSPAHAIGFVYFFSHPFLYPLLRARLAPVVVLSIVVLGLLFAFAYLPQVALLTIFHGPLAWVNAAFLVLGEGAAIVALLFEAFFVDETLVDVFDATLINEGHLALLLPAREIHSSAADPVKQLGKHLTSAQFGTVALIFQLVPVLSMLFLITTAAGAAMWAADLENQRRKELAEGQQPVGPSHSDSHV